MKDILRQLVVALLALSVLMCTSVLVNIHGWGLQPKSWWWIIGGTILGVTIAGLLMQLVKDGDD